MVVAENLKNGYVPHLIEIGSETGIEAEEHYCFFASSLEKKCEEKLAQKNMKKSETDFLKKMVEKALNIMVGGIFMAMNI